jgi:Protein of unknown function (DUF3562)
MNLPEQAMTATNSLSGNTARQKQSHEQAIETLVKETHVGIDRVRELYEAELERLASTARIKTFVAVIATRIVRTALTQNSHTAQ